MKVLYSAQYGIGWFTANKSVPGLAQFMATYPPLLEAVSARLTEIKAMEDFIKREKAIVIPCDHPIIKQMLAEIKDKFGLKEYEVCVLSSKYLNIYNNSCDAVHITDYDGLETVTPKCLDGLIFDPGFINRTVRKL